MKESSNRQNILWVIATPIGNLEDMAPRAVRILGEVDLILCEDTRRSAKLLSALNIQSGMKKLARLDAHTSPAQIGKWIQALSEGSQIALITDAGTPGISDPGSALVAAAHEAEIQVSPVPGACAVAALLSVCGFEQNSFAFHGFFPRQRGDQEKELASVSENTLWYESPQRVGKTLEFLAERVPTQNLVAAKELTKIHEKIFTGTVERVSELIKAELETQGSVGEWVLALQKSSNVETGPAPDWKLALKCLALAGVSASESARLVSQEFGISKREVYADALVLFKSTSKII